MKNMMTVIHNQFIPSSSDSLFTKLMACLDGRTKFSDARAQALASLGQNRIALTRAQIPAALQAHALISQTQPQAKVKRICYGYLEKEASERI